VGLSHCRYDDLVTVRDEACLRRGHNDQSRWGHQCSETMLTGESRFHISIPLGIEPGSLMTGSKRVDHWTSGTVYECSEIAGSPQTTILGRTLEFSLHMCTTILTHWLKWYIQYNYDVDLKLIGNTEFYLEVRCHRSIYLIS
jgi:hypothetical protein